METGVKRNTKRVGDISELRVMMALVSVGYRVAIPFGEDQRYDLIIEKDNVLSRVQVKTGRLRRGAIFFNCTSSHVHRGGTRKMYVGEVEYFGVFCPDNDSTYLLPIDEILVQEGVLRVLPPKNGQIKGLRWADRYLLQHGRETARPRSTVPEQLQMPS